MPPQAYEAWVNRDLEPHLHREAYLHVLRESGLPDEQAEALYERVIDPMSWTAYPDTAAVLNGLHRQGIKTAVVSNIAFDVRPAFEAIGAADDVDEFVLSFEVGAIKPAAAIFQTALTRLGVPPEYTVMVGDSEEADGGARALDCGFLLVDPLPTAQRPDGLRSALTGYGVDLDPAVASAHARWRARAATAVAQAAQQGLHGHVAARRADFAGRVAGGADGPRPQDRQTALDARHADGRSRASAMSSTATPARTGSTTSAPPDEVTLAQGSRTERVRMVELSPDDARPVLREFPAAVPTGVDLMKRVGLLTEGYARRGGGPGRAAARCSASTPSRSVAIVSNSERIRPPWWLKYVNKVMIGVQRLGFGFGGKGPVILTVRGRKSGKLRSTPITPMTVDGKRYVLGGLPGSDWAANVACRGRGRAAPGAQHRTGPDGRAAARGGPAAAAAVPGRSADRRRLFEERGFGDGTQPRRIRGARGPLPGLPFRAGNSHERESLSTPRCGNRSTASS